MGDSSRIEWCDATWNPVTGCTKVSAGCKNCYAERLAPKVFAGQIIGGHEAGCMGGVPGIHCVCVNPPRKRQFTDVRTHEDRLDQPLHWKKPRRIFVNSMSDLFHEDVPDEFLHRVYHTMEHAGQHTFQVLTKRAERMRAYLDWRYGPDAETPRGRIPSRHIWHGVSVENQHFADERIPLLLQTRSAVRFLSCEPLLGHLNIIQFLSEKYISVGGRQWIGAGGIQWVIFGGESGPGARPMELDWIRSGVRQCRDAGVAPFVKQIGALPRENNHPFLIGAALHRSGGYRNRAIGDRKGGDPSEWPEDLRVREFPEVRL